MKRLVYLDGIRGVAIIFVIFHHLCAVFIQQENIDSAWWAANFLITLSIPAVPLFVIISGALYLTSQKDIPISKFFISRFKKVGIPYIAWMIIYYTFSFLRFKKDRFQLHELGKELLEGHTTNVITRHFWFLPLIISLYLVTPVLRRFVQNASKGEKKLFLVMCAAFGSIVPVLYKFTDIRFGYQSYIYSTYILYFAAGYFLLNMSGESKHKRKLLLGLYPVGFMITFFGTYYSTTSSGSLDRFWYKGESPGVMLMSISSFIFIKHYWPSISKSKICTLLPYIGKMSFGVYLIHMLWILILSRGIKGYHLRPDFSHPFISVPILTLIILSLSLLSIYAIRAFPYGKTILPE